MKRWWLLLAMAACGGVSVQDFQTELAAARVCAAGDTCVIAGQAPCLCASPVNSKEAAHINEHAKEVSCGGAQVSCVSYSNPRCGNDGLCTATVGP